MVGSRGYHAVGGNFSVADNHCSPYIGSLTCFGFFLYCKIFVVSVVVGVGVDICHERVGYCVDHCLACSCDVLVPSMALLLYHGRSFVG